VSQPGSIGREESRRLRVRVEGVVQGVGFRPHVYRLATGEGLAGHVFNDERGVLIEVEGARADLDRFLRRLGDEAPALAHVERVSEEEIEPAGDHGFEIAPSRAAGAADALVSADTATCADCLAELRDPADRRHRYPFTNCTNCGPRFTIVRDVPYDRPATTMAAFAMCERCRAEYEDPADRRFHAQPNACPDCGPRAVLRDARTWEEVADPGAGDVVEAAARAVLDGRIAAVKGLGGYHLASRADDERAVSALRARKHREDKPFAVMAPDLEAARRLVELTSGDERHLTGPRRPIVVARERAASGIAPSVAPRSADLGVMLPYAPLHHLLAADAAVPLVLTSGNVSDEPIAFADDDARERLAPIADLFLLHDRPIHVRTDDSVLRTLDPDIRTEPLLIRRSRGYVPEALGLPLDAPPLLATGAELKSTFAIAKGRRAWVSHHIGDLKNFETLNAFRSGIAHFERLFAVTPRLVAHDLHPDYLSTRYALERDDLEPLGVQHHHAHLAAALAEHGHTGPAAGAIFDGAGYGPDGTVWGGELLVGSLGSYERAGLMFPVRLPGGDAATREPWRMACSWLAAALGRDDPPLPATLVGAVDGKRWEQVSDLARSGVSSPITSSAGRLFDAVAAIAGVRHTVDHEGQAAAELEGIADRDEVGGAGYEIPLIGEDEGPILIDAREVIRAVAADAGAGVAAAVVSGRFHAGLAITTAAACARIASDRGLDRVVLSGGVFQNRLLLERTWRELTASGLEVLVPAALPPNDGGIAFGQAAVAAATLAAS
jgi:hydrogenase maturation protein HypF